MLGLTSVLVGICLDMHMCVLTWTAHSCRVALNTHASRDTTPSTHTDSHTHSHTRSRATPQLRALLAAGADPHFRPRYNSSGGPLAALVSKIGLHADDRLRAEQARFSGGCVWAYVRCVCTYVCVRVFMNVCDEVCWLPARRTGAICVYLC